MTSDSACGSTSVIGNAPCDRPEQHDGSCRHQECAKPMPHTHGRARDGAVIRLRVNPNTDELERVAWCDVCQEETFRYDDASCGPCESREPFDAE